MSTRSSSRRKRPAEDDGTREKKRHRQQSGISVAAPASRDLNNAKAENPKAAPPPRSQVRPSDHWREFDADKVTDARRDIVTRGNWRFLCDRAVERYAASATATTTNGLSCTANLSRVTRGMFNAVFELSFSNGSFWVARVRFPTGRDDARTEMLSEVATMRLVAQRTSIPVPEVYCFDGDEGNPFGFAYMLMSALPGRVMRAPLALSVPPEFQPRVASQMAAHVRQLSGITFPEIGRVLDGDVDHAQGAAQGVEIAPFVVCVDGDGIGPFNSSTAYFRGLQQDVADVVYAEHEDDDDWEEWRRYLDVSAEAVPFLVCPDLRRGPFPLTHRDFHYRNMLFDDDFNVVGVLDWTDARVTPWEQFAIYGDIIPDGAETDEENEPTVRFRRLFIEAYRKLEGGGEEPGGGGRPGRTTLLSEIMDSPLPDLLMGGGVPISGEKASRDALTLLRGLFGPDTTFENYKARRRRQRGRPWWRPWRRDAVD